MKQLAVSLLLVMGSMDAAALANDSLPIVLSASRMAQSQDTASSAISVFTRSDIEQMGVRKITDILRLVPGMQTGSAYGNLQVATHHGLSDSYARRIQVLVDGRSIWQSATGGVFWGNIPVPIEDIDRIEVARGPNGASYGASALFATINIITSTPVERGAEQVRLTKGNKGVEDLYAHTGFKAGAADVSLSVTRNTDDGYAGMNDSRVDDAGLLQLMLPIGARDELSLEVGASSGLYDAGEDAPTNPLREIAQSDHFILASYRHVLRGGGDISLRASSHTFENEQQYVVEGVPLLGSVFFDYGYRAKKDEVELEHATGSMGPLRLVWGGSVRYDTVRSQSYFDTDEDQRNKTTMGFAHFEYQPVEGLFVNAGAMVENSDLHDRLVSPRFSLIYQPLYGHTLRAGVNSGSRAATLWENQSRQYIQSIDTGLKVYRTYSSGGLDVEKATSRELAYRYDMQGNSVELRAFQNTLRDLIVQQAAPAPAGLLGYYENGAAVIDMVNQDDLSVHGLEVEATLRPTRDTTVRLAAARSIIKLDGAPNPYNDYEASAPRYSGALMVTSRLGAGVEGGATLSRQSAMKWLGEDAAIEGYTRVDARLAKAFTLGGAAAKVELVGQNLLGAHADYDPLKEWETAYFVRLSMEM